MHDGSVVPTHDAIGVLRTMAVGGSMGSVILSLIMRACEGAELVAPNSSGLVIAVADELMRGMVHRQSCGTSVGQGLLEASAGVSDALDRVATLAAPVDRDALRASLVASFPGVGSLVYEAVMLAGNECKVFVRPASSTESTVERADGHVFRCSPDPTFYDGGRWEHQDVRLLIVDGLIENVSEIDVVLNRCHFDSCAMVIVARGFSPDVINTLRVNRARGTLNVMPVTAEFDVETVNVLIDIATVVGCDVVSSLKGELISTVRFDDLVSAKRVLCMGRSMTVVGDSSSTEAIGRHLKHLVEKKRSVTLLGVRSLLDERVRSLASSTVTIWVSAPSGLELTRKIRDVDVALRTVKSSIAGGCVVCPPGGFDGLLDQYAGTTLPSMTVRAGLEHGLSLALSLGSAGAALIEDVSPLQ